MGNSSTRIQGLKRLKKKNAVYIAEDPNDSRKKNISITRTGFELINGFQAGIQLIINDYEDILFGKFQ